MITERIQALEAKRIAAMLAGDADTLSSLIDADALYVHSTGDVDSGSEYVQKIRAGIFGYDAISVEEASVRQHHGTVIVVFRMKATVRVSEQRRESLSRCTAVWTWRDTTDRLIAFQATPIANP